MKAILLCLLVTYVTAQTQLGGKRCTWGPSYWCSHVNHAKACGAVEHCMSTVWKNQIIQPKNTNECIYCQYGFNELKEVLQNEEVQKEIAKYVSDVCKLLPNPDWKATCDGIVTEDLPILIEMLDNKIKSKMICAAIGMCSGLEDTYSPFGVLADKDKTEVKVSNSSCGDCMKFFQDVQQSITSKETESQLEQVLDQFLCSRIPSLTTLCQDALESLIPSLLQFLADQLDPNIVCRVFGFCVSSKHLDVIPMQNVFKDLKQPLKYRSDEECEACKDILTEVVNTIRDNNTQTTVKTYIETYICDNLGALAGTCKEVVEEYLPQLVELLVNELDPTTFCEAIGLCTVPSGSLTIPALKIEPALLISDGYTVEGEICTICTIVMQEVQNLLKSNVTIMEVEDLINLVCEKLPSEDLEGQCLAFIKEYGPMVVEKLAEEISPSAICAFLKLCTSKSTVSVANVKDLECDFCVLGVTQLQKLLANVSTDEIVSDLKAVCAFLPANLSLTCVKYVQEYVPIAIDLLKSEKDPKALCQLAEICTTSSRGRHPFMTKPIPEDSVSSLKQEKIPDNLKYSTECEVCNTILFTLKELLKNNYTEEEVEAELEKLCDYLGDVKSECESIVTAYGKMIIDFLINDLDPMKVCTMIGLCQPTLTDSLNLKTGILSPVDTLPIFAKEVKKVEVVNIAEKKTFKGEGECEACMLVMGAADTALQQKYTQDKIKDLMLDVCKDLPGFHSECANLVNTYYMVAINYLLLSQSPASICKELELCPATEKQPQSVDVNLSPDSSEQLPVSSGKVEGSSECAICEFVMQELDKLLKENASKADIKKALDEVCSLLPASISTECNQFVAEYSPLIINLLLEELEPSQVCKELKLCSSNKMKGYAATVKLLSTKDTVSSGKAENTIECTLCEMVMQKLEDLLEANATEADIEKALDKVCSLLPSSISSECKAFVDQYSPLIIKLLLGEVKPADVCKSLGLCSSNQMKGLAATVKLLSTKDTGDSYECDICKFFVEQLNEYIKENKTVAEIEHLLEEFCDELPDTISAQCEEAIQMYVPAILDMIRQGLNASAFCQKAGICNATHNSVIMKEENPSRTTPQKTDDTLFFKPQLLGKEKCTYGPSFWCASKKNAELCGAEEHCRLHVWN